MLVYHLNKLKEPLKLFKFCKSLVHYSTAQTVNPYNKCWWDWRYSAEYVFISGCYAEDVDVVLLFLFQLVISHTVSMSQ